MRGAYRKNSKIFAAAAVAAVLAERANAADSYTILHNFTGASTDGAYPSGTPLISGTTLYGTAGDGATGNGTIFSYNLTTASINFLYGFKGGTTDGGGVLSSLTRLGNNLYGMTSNGGSADIGTIYEYNPSTNVESLVHSFTGPPDGRNPQ